MVPVPSWRWKLKKYQWSNLRVEKKKCRRQEQPEKHLKPPKLSAEPLKTLPLRAADSQPTVVQESEHGKTDCCISNKGSVGGG